MGRKFHSKGLSMQVPVEGGTLHCEVRGEGPPVVVIHGGLGFDHHYLLNTMAELANEWRLIFVDLRGNGASTRPTTPEGWNRLDDTLWWSDLEKVRAHLGCERWTVFGHSYGSFLTQQYALA